MSEAMGPQTFGDHEELMFLGREISRHRDYSDETARRIDAEVASILREAYKRAEDILTQHRDRLDLLATVLLERETMDGRDAEDLVKHGRILTEAERAAEDEQKLTASGPAKSNGNAPVAVS
jgi:cell division protease FtsH